MSVTAVSKFAERIEEFKYSNFLYWLLENWIISSGEFKGEKYSFKGRPYLIDIAKHESDFFVIQKSAQCGISELNIARAFYMLDKEKLNILYVFPSATQLRSFVNGRIKPAVNNNYYLLNRIGGAFNTEQLIFNGRMGENVLYLTGAKARTQMISRDVSVLFIDEIDEIAVEDVFTLEKRLGAASHPRKFYFSTPSESDIGVNYFFERSTKREWMVKCTHCGFEQVLDWELNIKQFYSEPTKEAKILCQKCLNPITDEARLSGRWVAEHPDAPYEGFHISKLMDVRFDANYFLENGLEPEREKEFYKSDLGLPYETRGNRVTIEDFKNAIDHRYTMQNRSTATTYMGVDVGNKLHVEIMTKLRGKYKTIFAGEFKEFNELSPLLKRFNVRTCVIDINPERRAVKDFAEKHRGVVYMADYTSYDKLVKKKEHNWLQIYREEAMDLVIRLYKDGMRSLPADIQEKVPDYIKHTRTPVRSMEKDKNGNYVMKFHDTNKPDHYFHAQLYAIIAAQIAPPAVRFINRGYLR